MPQSGENYFTKRFFIVDSFTVIINSGVKKKLAPLHLGAKHSHLYLVVATVVVVSANQFDATITDGKTIALLGSNSVTDSKVPIAVWIFEFYTSPLDGEAFGSVTQPSGVAATQG